MASAMTVGKVLAEIVLCGFPNFNPTAEMTQVWIAYFSDVDDDLLVKALRYHISTSKSAFAPSVSEIRAAAAHLKARIAGLPDAFEAWQDTVRAGSGERVWVEGDTIHKAEYKFIHPLVKSVAEQLGWPRDFMNDSVTRAHFLKAWDIAISKVTEGNAEIPEIKAFVDSRRNAKALPIGEMAKQLEVSK